MLAKQRVQRSRQKKDLFKVERIMDYDDQNYQVTLNRATKIFALCAALNSCNLGFDIGVTTSAGKLLQSENSLELNDEEISLFMGSLNLFAALGAILASRISDKFGRRGGFLVAAIGFIIGITIECLANSFALLMIGRALVGAGVGFGLAIDPIYIAEISPPSFRGGLVTWSEIGTNVGIVIGFSSGLFFYKAPADDGWRLMFAMGMIMPLILIYLIFNIMPESPRWLVSKGMDDDAKNVLEKIYPPGHDVAAVINDIRESIQREEEADKSVGWSVIFQPSPAFKRMLVVGVGTAISQQIVGIDAIQYFLMYIVEDAGVEGRIQQSIILIILGVFKLAIILCAGHLFDSKGRRPLMFISLFGMSISLAVISITFFFPDSSAVYTIIALALYLAFFSVGMGPGAWLIPAEVFSTSIRAKAMSVSTFLNRLAATLVTSTFLGVAELITWGGFFALMSSICLLVIVFFYFYLPETKGKSLEEMSMFFAQITGDNSILEAEQRLTNRKPTDYPSNTIMNAMLT